MLVIGSGLTLKQTGIQSILAALEQVQERRGLPGLIRRGGDARARHLLGVKGQFMLKALSIHRSHDAQPNRRGEKSAQVQVEKQTRHDILRQSE
jgi:hypothetical protein